MAEKGIEKGKAFLVSSDLAVGVMRMGRSGSEGFGAVERFGELGQGEKFRGGE